VTGPQLEWEALKAKKKAPPPLPLEKVTYPTGKLSQLIIDEGPPQLEKPVSWATLESEAIRQRLAGETRPTPTPSPVDTKGYYVSEETGRHVLTSPKLIRESHVELQKQGYMDIGGKRVRGVDIEWEPHGVPSKFAWWPERRAARAWKQELRQKYPKTKYEIKFKNGEAAISLLPEVAQARWKEETLKQYPRDKYMILWRGMEAQIFEKVAKPSPISTRQFASLEREAQDAWKVIQARFAEAAKPKWTPPRFKGVSKRFAGLAEYDIPYNVEQMATQLSLRRKEAKLKPLMQPLTTTEQKPLTIQEKYALLRQFLPEEKPVSKLGKLPTALELKRREYDLASFIGPTLISIKVSGDPRLSTTLLGEAKGDPWKQFGAGLTAAVETGLEFFFPYPTPTPEHHKLLALPKQPPAYIVGRAIGEVASAFALGWTFQAPLTYGVEKVSALGKKVIPKGVQQWAKFGPVAKGLSKAKVAIKTKLPKWKGSEAELWVIRHSKLYAKQAAKAIAPGEVALKPLPPKGVGLKEFVGTEAYWKMIQAPKTAGVMVGKPSLTTKGLQTYMFEWMLKGEKLVPRFRPQRAEEIVETQVKDWAKYWQPERGMLPYVTQTQLTRLGVVPYAAKPTATVAREITRKTLGPLAVATAMKIGFPQIVKPKIEDYMPTFTREREKFRSIMFGKLEEEQKRRYALVTLKPKLNQLLYQPLKPRVILKPKEERKQFVVPWLREAQILREKQVLIPKLALKQRQEPMQRLKPITMPPMIQPPYVPYKPPLFPLFDLTGLQRRGRRGPRWGAWFYREHPIARARTVVGLVTGRPRRRNGMGDFNRINQAMRGSKRRKPQRTQLGDVAKRFNGKVLGKTSATSPTNIFNRRMKQLKLRSNGTRRGKVRRRQSRSPLDSFNRIRSVL